jgi:hypothetical protein
MVVVEVLVADLLGLLQLASLEVHVTPVASLVICHLIARRSVQVQVLVVVEALAVMVVVEALVLPTSTALSVVTSTMVPTHVPNAIEVIVLVVVMVAMAQRAFVLLWLWVTLSLSPPLSTIRLWLTLVPLFTLLRSGVTFMNMFLSLSHILSRVWTSYALAMVRLMCSFARRLGS